MIIKQHGGYAVSTVAENGQKLYVRRVYKGRYTFNWDYTHAKTFKSIETARKHDAVLRARGPILTMAVEYEV